MSPKVARELNKYASPSGHGVCVKPPSPTIIQAEVGTEKAKS